MRDDGDSDGQGHRVGPGQGLSSCCRIKQIQRWRPRKVWAKYQYSRYCSGTRTFAGLLVSIVSGEPLSKARPAGLLPLIRQRALEPARQALFLLAEPQKAQRVSAWSSIQWTRDLPAETH